MSAESIRYITDHPIPMDRGTLIGRAGLDRTTQQIADVLADPDYSRQDLQRVAGFRTTMGAPMLSTTRWSARCASGATRSVRSTSSSGIW